MENLNELNKKESLLLNDLDISIRLYQFLKNAGIKSLEELTEKSESDLIQIKEIDQISLKELKSILKEKGLSLKN